MLAGVVILALDSLQRSPSLDAAAAVWMNPAMPDIRTLQETARGEIPMPAGAAAAHASSLLVMPEKNPAALTI